MKIRYAAKTDVGMKRTHNEDYFSLVEDEHLSAEDLRRLRALLAAPKPGAKKGGK